MSAVLTCPGLPGQTPPLPEIHVPQVPELGHVALVVEPRITVPLVVCVVRKLVKKDTVIAPVPHTRVSRIVFRRALL